MIFYFSATGNSKYVAERLAELINDKTVSIEECGDAVLDCSKEKFLGFVAPTYCWGLPTIFMDFLNKKIKVNNRTYVYLVATYGTTPGAIRQMTKKYLVKNNITLHGAYSVKMPDTYTPWFNLSNQDKNKKRNKKAEVTILKISEKIKKRQIFKHMKMEMPGFFLKVTPIAYENMRKTSHFYVEDSCIGCGLCERKCPINAIEIEQGKPIWKKDKCVMCFGCVHRCPKFSIQYGNGKTKKHGQYLNPNTKV